MGTDSSEFKLDRKAKGLVVQALGDLGLAKPVRIELVKAESCNLRRMQSNRPCLGETANDVSIPKLDEYQSLTCHKSSIRPEAA